MTKPTLHLSQANQLTQFVRDGVKNHASEDPAKLNKDIASRARAVAKKLSKVDLTKDTEASKTALKLADHVARPVATAWKYGAHVSNGVDYALSFAVGRGIKLKKDGTQETPEDMRKLTQAGPHRWTALRQEGVLGLLTRGTAMGLGCLVGAIFTGEKGAATASAIENAGVGFNAGVRTAVLTLPTILCSVTSLLVGCGVSALTAMVAVPKLWRLKDVDASEPENKADADKVDAKEADKPEPKADQGEKKPGLWKRFAAKRAKEEASSVSPEEQQAAHAADMMATLAALEKSGGPTDKARAKLEKAYTTAKKAYESLVEANGSAKDIAAALKERNAAHSALQAHKNPAIKGAKLKAACEQAREAFKAASKAGDPEAESSALEAFMAAEEKLKAHEAASGKASPASGGKLPEATLEQLQNFEGLMVGHAERAARGAIDKGEPLPTSLPAHKEVEARLKDLSDKGLIEKFTHMPFFRGMITQMNEFHIQADGHLKNAVSHLGDFEKALNEQTLGATHELVAAKAAVEAHNAEAAAHFERAGTLPRESQHGSAEAARQQGKAAQSEAFKALDKVRTLEAGYNATNATEGKKLLNETGGALLESHDALAGRLAAIAGRAALTNVPVGDEFNQMLAEYHAIKAALAPYQED